VPRSLRKVLKRGDFTVTCDKAFDRVLVGCAMPAPGRPETWINETIVRLFTDLHAAGLAHSVETWRGEDLVGGLYGLAMGGAFFGESMFSTADNASKVALCHLVGLMRRGGFVLLDAQFMTDHLRQFGTIEIAQKEYLGRLAAALTRQGLFQGPLAPDDLLAELSSQASTHTS
jgi:leucyl/phenylalanyl-tRNA--protein transferase